MSTQILAQARQTYLQVVPHLFERKNVVACGLGFKIRGLELTDELSLIVSVLRKLPREVLDPQDIVPRQVNGLTTDVVETGCIRAMLPDPRERHRPAMPGLSVGHFSGATGTFGLLVEREGSPYILSNNHVLASCNDAQIGDPILQPGPLDGGTLEDQIAELTEFEPLDFGVKQGECQFTETLAAALNTLAKWGGSHHRLQSVQQTAGENRLDAALARPLDPALVNPAMLGQVVPAGVGMTTLGERVRKWGRTTGYTEGTVQQIDVTAQVDYNGRMVYFVDQIITSRMSSRGDSGSGILDMEDNAVGLLFAGSERVTLFTPVNRVLARFGVQLVT
ncbi:MAG: trypsin-like peptidase domain-containing protein [Anaerolineales bacterium]